MTRRVPLAEAKRDSVTRRVPLLFLPDFPPVGVQDRLVRGVLGEGILAMLHGESGSGKSFTALDLGMHVPLGWLWFGRKVTPGAVLYVAAEGRQVAWANRIEAFCRHHQLDADQRARLPIAFVLAHIDLGKNGDDVETAIRAAAELKKHSGEVVKLIVIDTMARATPGSNENDPVDVGGFIGKCDAIRDATEATVLIVHHTGKNLSAGARGHSALHAAVDAEIEVERTNGHRLLRVKKSRDGADGAEIGFALSSLEVGRDDEGEPITSCVVVPAEVVSKKGKANDKEKWQLALDVLDNTLADYPEEPPNRVAYPSCTLTQVPRFQEALKRAGVADAEDPATWRSQWKRIKDKLMEKGFYRQIGNLCWRPVA